MKLSNVCPVCNECLYVSLRYKPTNKRPYYIIECDMNPEHFRAFVNRWPRSWDGVDFDKWIFQEGDMRCPVCNGDLVGSDATTKKARKSCIYCTCSDRKAHVQMFFNTPDKLKWSDFHPEEMRDGNTG